MSQPPSLSGLYQDRVTEWLLVRKTFGSSGGSGWAEGTTEVQWCTVWAILLSTKATWEPSTNDEMEVQQTQHLFHCKVKCMCLWPWDEYLSHWFLLHWSTVLRTNTHLPSALSDTQYQLLLWLFPAALSHPTQNKNDSISCVLLRNLAESSECIWALILYSSDLVLVDIMFSLEKTTRITKSNCQRITTIKPPKPIQLLVLLGAEEKVRVAIDHGGGTKGHWSLTMEGWWAIDHNPLAMFCTPHSLHRLLSYIFRQISYWKPTEEVHEKNIFKILRCICPKLF